MAIYNKPLIFEYAYQLKVDRKNKHMKKITFGLLSFLAITQLNAQKLQIAGDLKNVPEGATVSLIDGMANKVIDSSKSVGGKFTLRAKIENPSIYVLGFAGLPAKIPVFVGNDQMTVSGDIQKAELIEYKGSASQDLYLSYMKTLTPKIQGLFGDKSLVASPAGSKAKDSIAKEIELKEADIAKTVTDLIKSNNKSPVSTLFLIQTANFAPYIKDHIADMYALLDGPAKKGPFADLIEKSVQSAGVGKVGSVLPEFKQNDVNGKSVSLSSLRGKYVLIDFWASWCGPCRAENPNVVKAYNAYKTKGFTILGVSLDQDKSKWLEAIKKDGLTWTHVSDLKYWNNEIAVQFGIQSIPANFLIDPKGVVIGRDLRGEDLEKILATNIK
jgi:peroxiredoxin